MGIYDLRDTASVWCAPNNIVLRFIPTVTRICGVLNIDAIVTVHILILVLKIYVGTDNDGTPIWQIAQNNSLSVRVRVPFSNNIRNARSLYKTWIIPQRSVKWKCTSMVIIINIIIMIYHTRQIQY